MAEVTETNNITNNTSEEDAAASNSPKKETNGTSLYKGYVSVFLPTLEVQYVCGDDIRPGFNTTDTFEDLYQSLLPDMAEPHLTTTERISGMDHILQAYEKWKIKQWGCNTTSSEVLMTFKVKGFAFFDRSSPDIAKMDEVINRRSVREYFATNVCSNLREFQVFVESPFRKESKSNDFDQVQHHVSVLCAGTNYFEYDDDDDEADPIFVLFGIFVGYYMVRMILVELQKYGRNRRRRHEGFPSYTQVEVEMM